MVLQSSLERMKGEQWASIQDLTIAASPHLAKLAFTRRLRRKPGQCSSMLPEASNYPRQNWGKDITLWRRRFTQNGASMFSRSEGKRPPRHPLSRLTCDKSSKI